MHRTHNEASEGRTQMCRPKARLLLPRAPRLPPSLLARRQGQTGPQGAGLQQVRGPRSVSEAEQ
eukprot:scaffold279000_cov26-Tisochrysis_lutea.AAC.3